MPPRRRKITSPESEASSLTPEKEAIEQAAELRTIFTNKPRWEFVKLVSNGSFGGAFQVRYKDPDPAEENVNYIVKRAFNDIYARKSLNDEKDVLEKLSGNKHIVQIYNFPHIPLATSNNIIKNSWMVLEWIPSGTIEDWIYAVKVRFQSEILPNRLLWSLYLCLIRAAIAMAWPNNSETVQLDVKPSGLRHNDMHTGNIMVGDDPDGEHVIAPILKLIDFGQADYEEGGESLNIHSIARVIIRLLNARGKLGISDDWPEIEWKGKRLPTGAVSLFPFPDGVDPLLLNVLCASQAVTIKDRPTLGELFEIAQTRIANPPEIYKDEPEEQDEAILSLWRDISLNAQTSPVIEPQTKRQRFDSS